MKQVKGAYLAAGLSALSEGDSTAQPSGLQHNKTSRLTAEPPHSVEDQTGNDVEFVPRESPHGYMPRCLPCALFNSTGGQESEDLYGRSMQSGCTTTATVVSSGCGGAQTHPSLFTPGASTSVTPALTETHSVSGARSIPQQRWGGNYDSSSQCMSFRGIDRSGNLSGLGLRLVDDEAEWMHDSFEEISSSPRDEVSLSWRNLQQQQQQRQQRQQQQQQQQQHSRVQRSASDAIPPPLGVSAVILPSENAHGGHYRFERAVQPPTQRQQTCSSPEEENRQAAAMLWAATQMATCE